MYSTVTSAWPSAYDEMATDKLKRHKSLGSDQIPSEFIKAGVGPVVLRSINLLIQYGNME
jgi:hypothetical protein